MLHNMDAHVKLHEEATLNDANRAPRPPFENEPKPRVGSFFLEVLKFAVIAFLIVAPIRLFVAQPFIVSGSSMEPNFENGDYLIVDQLTYHFQSPERGEVVVFRLPEAGGRFLIKRIIGLPGETITIRGANVFAEAKGTDTPIEIDEWYVDTDNRQYENYSVDLKDDEYFVMGDNRDESSDSRAWGPLTKDEIGGRAFIRLLPVTHVEIFPGTHND